MGGSSSTKAHPEAAVTTAEQKSRNKSIEEKIRGKRAEEKSAVKVLLLGAGECGKSTILKQMKILHLNGFTPEELELYQSLCRKNTLDSIQTLCRACLDLGIPFDSPVNKEKATTLLAVSSSDVIPLTLKDDILAMWADAGVKKSVTRENEFHLMDSAGYFLENIERVFQADFVPTQQDVLRARLTTTGIIETNFVIEQMGFKVYDVGGQRGERKKWIHCFDDVTAIMFIASLSEYDQVLAEDRTRNRLVESLDLFEGIVNLPWFEKASIILFLNKNDLFQAKVVKIDIGDFHPDYTGGKDYDAGLQFIRDEYFDRNENESKMLYCHVTDATNTNNIEFVWKSTQHIILENKLTSSGLQMC